MQNFKTVPQTLLGETAHFGFCPPKIGFFGGAWGGPQNFIFIEILIFCYLGAPAKFQNGNTKPSGRNCTYWLLSAPNWLFWGAWGGPPYFFSYLGAPAKFQNCSTNLSGRNSPFRLLSAQNRLFWGARGVPEIFSSSLESSYFCYLGAHAILR